MQPGPSTLSGRLTVPLGLARITRDETQPAKPRVILSHPLAVARGGFARPHRLRRGRGRFLIEDSSVRVRDRLPWVVLLLSAWGARGRDAPDSAGIHAPGRAPKSGKPVPECGPLRRQPRPPAIYSHGPFGQGRPARPPARPCSKRGGPVLCGPFPSPALPTLPVPPR